MKTISEIRKEGISALSKKLGPVDMARFIQSYETGSGDYAKERHRWLPDNIDEVKERLFKRQKKIEKNKSSPIFSPIYPCLGGLRAFT